VFVDVPEGLDFGRFGSSLVGRPVRSMRAEELPKDDAGKRKKGGRELRWELRWELGPDLRSRRRSPLKESWMRKPVCDREAQRNSFGSRVDDVCW